MHLPRLNPGRFVTFISVWMIFSPAHASTPPIEQAQSDVRGYMQCVQDAYNADRWHSRTIDECRTQFPAVQSLRQGDYVAVTFTGEQNRLYEQARQRWIDFDKAVRVQILSKGLAEQFAAANVTTAYSFDKLSRALDARFSELEAAPFSWYPAKKAPYRTAQGLTLEQVQQKEKQQFITCLEKVVNAPGSLSITKTNFDNQARQCLQEISRFNLDGSNAIFQPETFQAITAQGWQVIAAQQSKAEEAERVRLAKEEAESWPSLIKALLGKIVVALLAIGGLYALWRAFLNAPASSTGSSRDNYGHSTGGGYSYSPTSDPRDPPSQSTERTSRAKPVDLGTFTLKHRKVGPLTTQHRCASCTHWRGERTPHPVTREWYVKHDTKGPCGHKHPGSPHGVKRDMEGFYCKNFQEGGF
ncbi:MAG: hypothetical protein RR736_12020 [Pseudomonas sp.]|uniref:hypothetical protein n=1 Tax=Pseudomonas sp. TaxID=306 RepID=UPI002FC9F378